MTDDSGRSPQARTASDGVVTGYGSKPATFAGQALEAALHCGVSARSAGLASTGGSEHAASAHTADEPATKRLRERSVVMVDNATGGGCALPGAARMRSVPACLNGAVTNVWTPRVGGDAPTVDDVGELGVLRSVLAVVEPAAADVGPGDDAAVLTTSTGRTVVTTDSMVLGLDWRDDWSSPQDVGVKVIAQNLADVVAMGARPTGVVVALAAEGATRVDWLVDLTRGMADELRRAGVGSFGGDLSGAPDGTVAIAVTALGDLPAGREPLLRANARVGESIIVSDVLGRSHAGLLVLLGEVAPSERAGTATQECVGWHRAPRPRYAGDEAAAAGVRCAMDVSDGLMLDAARIVRASSVRLAFDGDALRAMARPLEPVVGDRALECALSGGEEHALLATSPEGRVPAGWHVVGRVEDGQGVTLDGEPAQTEGWTHFGAR